MRPTGRSKHGSRWALALFATIAITTSACAADDAEPAAETPATQPTRATTTADADRDTTTTSSPGESAPIVIAHRGASGSAPEHTFAAYDLALEQGADFIEQDLQLTADGELVVLHDDTLDRTARGPAEVCSGPVATKTLAQLGQCEVGSWFNEAHPDRADPAFVGSSIPTMREVLAKYGSDVRYYVEIKSPEDSPGMEQALLDLLDEAGVAGSRPEAGSPPSVLVQSFSADSLRTLHGLRPDLPLVQLVSVAGPTMDQAFLDATAEYADGLGPPSGTVDATLVAAAHQRCLVVHPYTVDDPSEMTRLLDAGVDGMFTNVTDVLVATLAARGTVERPDPACPD